MKRIFWLTLKALMKKIFWLTPNEVLITQMILSGWHEASSTAHVCAVDIKNCA